MAENYITHSEFADYQKRIDTCIDKYDKLLYGNGTEGLRTEVVLNKKFRIDMEEYLKSMTKKVLGMLVVLIFVMLGGFTFLAISMGAF